YTVPREGKDVPPVVYKRVVEDFGATNPLSQSCVPYAQLVHDRLSIEILRGCARGCRFCQAGMTYRPVRERSADQIVSSVIQGLEKTGYDEVSLTSLSPTDHSCIRDVLGRLNRRLEDTGIRVSIPSQRLDSFGVDMAESVAGEKKGGLTFAPEAGSQRMRDIINKNVTEEDLDRAAKAAFEAGWNRMKLYFDGPSRRARRGHRGHRQSGRSRAGARSFRGAQGSSRLDLGVDLGFGLYP
ncbi:MAG: radical SAM protein, partial [Collinsella sp.]